MMAAVLGPISSVPGACTAYPHCRQSAKVCSKSEAEFVKHIYLGLLLWWSARRNEFSIVDRGADRKLG